MSETNSQNPAQEQYNAPLRAHEFDGIREFDNKLPMWWLWTFFGAIIFSVGYWFHYEVFHTGPGQIQAYETEVAKAKALQDKLIAETMDLSADGLLKMSKDPEAIARGLAVFNATCVACHLADGSGSIGPNLTDNYWLHGGGATQIYKTVVEGVPLKGMQAWGPVLGPKRVADVSVYLLTIKGTNKKGKKPEGKLEEGD